MSFLYPGIGVNKKNFINGTKQGLWVYWYSNGNKMLESSYTDNKKDMVEMNKMYSKISNTDYMILDDVNEKIKVVHFNGVNNTIHKYKENFIEKYWG